MFVLVLTYRINKVLIRLGINPLRATPFCEWLVIMLNKAVLTRLTVPKLLCTLGRIYGVVLLEVVMFLVIKEFLLRTICVSISVVFRFINRRCLLLAFTTFACVGSD